MKVVRKKELFLGEGNASHLWAHEIAFVGQGCVLNMRLSTEAYSSIGPIKEDETYEVKDISPRADLSSTPNIGYSTNGMIPFAIERVSGIPEKKF